MKFSRILVAASGFAASCVMLASTNGQVGATQSPGCQVWVTSDSTPYITVLHPTESPIPETLPTGDGGNGPNSYSVTFERNGRKAYVAAVDRVLVYDIQSYELLATVTQSAFGVVASPVADEVYVAAAINNVVGLSTVTDTLDGRTVAVGGNPAKIIVSATGDYVYVSSVNVDPVTITRVSVSTFTGDQVFIGSGWPPRPIWRPFGLALTTDNSRLFVSDELGSNLLSIATSEIGGLVSLATTTSAGPKSSGMAFDESRNTLLVTAPDSNALVVLDASSLSILRPIGVGSSPRDVALSPDGRFAFVANYASNTISQIRLSDYVEERTFPVNGSPFSLAVGPPGCTMQIQQSEESPSVTPFFRATLDPNGGSCSDSTARTATWTSAFIGYRYLPGPSDCIRPGYAFGGWANTTTPTVPRNLPLLTDPSSDTKRYFVAENLDLVAVWKPLPTVVSNLVVFANFFCGPCTNAWLIHTPSEHATSYDYTLNSTPATCSPSITVLGLHACQLTSLTAGTPLTATVTPRNTDGTGPSTTTTFTLRR